MLKAVSFNLNHSKTPFVAIMCGDKKEYKKKNS